MKLVAVTAGPGVVWTSKEVHPNVTESNKTSRQAGKAAQALQTLNCRVLDDENGACASLMATARNPVILNSIL